MAFLCRLSRHLHILFSNSASMAVVSPVYRNTGGHPMLDLVGILLLAILTGLSCLFILGCQRLMEDK